MNARKLIPVSVLDDYDWACVFGEESGSSLTAFDFKRSDVDALYIAEDGEPDGAPWVAVGRLKDGRYFLVTGWCDYTGWGCQNGNEAETWPTWVDFVRGCGDEIRAKLGLGLDGLGSTTTTVEGQ